MGAALVGGSFSNGATQEGQPGRERLNMQKVPIEKPKSPFT